jgi:hypothetical protein
MKIQAHIDIVHGDEQAKESRHTIDTICCDISRGSPYRPRRA